MKITIRTPASCGELLEGQVNGVRQLISLPINIYNQLTIEIKPDFNHSAQAFSIPTEYSKAYQAAALFYQRYQLMPYFERTHLHFQNQITVGKGLASSTADIVNVLYGLSHFHDIALSQQDIALMALEIEPSDSTMFNTLTLYDFINGSQFTPIGAVPEFDILIFELPHQVDTVSMYQSHWVDNHHLDQAVQDIQTQLSLENLGKAAIQSAINHQHISNKPYLNHMLDLVDTHQLYGMNIAHSGSVMGFWYHHDRHDIQLIEKQLHNLLTDLLCKTTRVSTVAGGAEIVHHA